ncbi:MAG: type II secretion system protein [Candidatus Margulisiibacteriota bacterium]|jgi:prepilin-type N-terminal cleavage/methylation domain-containing protein
MNKEKGFTLIELIIVLGIISLIAAIIYPNFLKIQEKAKLSALKTTSHSLEMAIESYYLTAGSYPEGSNLAVTELVSTLKSSGELTKDPVNPFTGKIYTAQDASGKIVYNATDNNEKYSLTAYGKNNETVVVLLGD